MFIFTEELCKKVCRRGDSTVSIPFPVFTSRNTKSSVKTKQSENRITSTEYTVNPENGSNEALGERLL